VPRERLVYLNFEDEQLALLTADVRAEPGRRVTAPTSLSRKVGCVSVRRAVRIATVTEPMRTGVPNRNAAA